jgi:hypothetical protein
MNPHKRQAKLDEARRACNAGDAAGAERICQALLRVNRADLPALHMLGVIAAWRQDYTAAQGWFERCTALAPRDVSFMRELARVHTLAGRHAAALTQLQRAAELQPANPQTLTDLADVLERSGQAARAWELLGPCVEAGAADMDMALVAVRVLGRLGRVEPALALARQQLVATGGDAFTRRFLLQQLGRLLDQSGDPGGAFQAFAQAKQLEDHRFVPADFARDMDALIAAFSPQALARLPRASPRAETPVFIACMPRSGSTLVEQIIHAHPQAHGGGETPLLHRAIVGLPALLGGGLPYPQCVAALDAGALERVAAQVLSETTALAPDALRVTNKHLLNWLHLGMVSLLFPGARVIHVRRDPLDNGLACFMTSLSPALMPWAGELAHIGFAWRQVERLMTHWRATLDLRWLELNYEDLVDDAEPQVRRIIDFCGLPWDERCLRWWEAERVVLTPSYDQVRQPIFSTAKGRWRKYEEFLAPLKSALA